MSFECEPCFDKAKYKCPQPKELHSLSQGSCEICRKTAVCFDCPTWHVEQVAMADPEYRALMRELAALGEQ